MADYILKMKGEDIDEALARGVNAVITSSQDLTQTEQTTVRNNIDVASKSDTISSISLSDHTFTITRADGTSFSIEYADNNTWDANSLNVAGYVSAPDSSKANQVWKTDGYGNPDWREDANTTYDLVNINTPGLVPGLPPDTDSDKLKKFLNASGRWVKVEYNEVSTTEAGLVKQLPPSGGASQYLNGEGNWVTINYSPSDHTHTTTITGTSKTSDFELSSDTFYELTAGGTSFVFKTPPNVGYNAGTGLSLSSNTFNHSNSITPTSSTQQVYPVTIDAQGHITSYGSAKTILTIGTGAANAAAGNHTHDIYLASDSGTPSVTFASAGIYKLTAGGQSVIFKMPKSNDYTHPSYTAHTAAAVKIGNDSTGHVTIGAALTASDVGAATSNHTHTISLSPGGTSTVTLAANTAYTLTAGGTSVIFKTPPDNNTTYSAGTGISISSNTINNSGVRSISTGSANGTISVNTNGTAANVAVKGLGTAAYTASSAYAAASHNHAASNITSGILAVAQGGTGVSTWTASAAADYTTAKPRAIIIQNSTPSSVTNGYIVLVYS